MMKKEVRAEQFGHYWTVAYYDGSEGTKQLLGYDNQFHEGLAVTDVRLFSRHDAEQKAKQLKELNA